METTRTCPQCQEPLSPDAPDGLCPQCLMKAASGPPPSAAGDGLAGDIIDIGDPAEVAKKLPQFEILEMLGRGGMGVVYKARQLQLDRLVALKILPPVDALSADFVVRFTREARSLAKLNHPNIVNVYDFGETGGLYYIVMEYVDGVNLRELFETRKLTPAEALAIVPKICDALQYAHDEGLVHRDIKPENLLIDKKGRVKIADFGLAKMLRREPLDMTLTLSGMTLGTMRYMAPEQMDKPETVDHRADLYSLGVVFYEMLTGETPVGRFELPSQKAQVDARLDGIVLHALEREPERRYQHASQMKTEVETVSSTPAPSAPPQPPPGKGWAAWVWWTLLALIAVLILVLAEWSRNEKMLGHHQNAEYLLFAAMSAPVLGVFAVFKLLELRWAVAQPFSKPWLKTILAVFGLCMIGIGPFPGVEWFHATLEAPAERVATAAGRTFELAAFSQTYVMHGFELWRGQVIAAVSFLTCALLWFAPRRPRWNVACSLALLLAGAAIGSLSLDFNNHQIVHRFVRSELDELTKTDPIIRQFREDFRSHAKFESAEMHNADFEQLFAVEYEGQPKKHWRLRDDPLFGSPWYDREPGYGSLVCRYAALALILIGVMRLRRTMQFSPAELAGVPVIFRAAETWSCLLLLVPCLLSVRNAWVLNVAAIPLKSVLVHAQPDDLAMWLGPWIDASSVSQAGSEFWQGRVIAAACIVAILAFIATALKLCRPGVRAAALSLAGVVSIACVISLLAGKKGGREISWRDFHAVAQHGAEAVESPEIRRVLAEWPIFVGLLAELERKTQALTTSLAAGETITVSADGKTTNTTFTNKLAQARWLAEGGVVDISRQTHPSGRVLLLAYGLLLFGVRDGYRCWRSRRPNQAPSL